MLSGIDDLADYAVQLSQAKVPLQILSAINIADDVEVTVARFDLLDEKLSGNKVFKLLPFLLDAKKKGYKRILSLGGIHSNHLHAMAYAANRFGFGMIAVVRSYPNQHSPTLQDLQDLGVDVLRQGASVYAQRNTSDYWKNLQEAYPDAYMIPEGGKGDLGEEGARLMFDVLSNSSLKPFTHVAVAAGTGTTFSGFLKHELSQHTKICVYSALQNADELRQMAGSKNKQRDFSVSDRYCFGGFAKMNSELARFIVDAEKRVGIPLDPIYTAKLLYGMIEDINSGAIKNGSKVCMIHTGGLQGRRAMMHKIDRLVG